MAKRMTTQMAIAMAVATEQNMAHSTPLHSKAGSHSSSGEWGPGKRLDRLTALPCPAMNELQP